MGKQASIRILAGNEIKDLTSPATSPLSPHTSFILSGHTYLSQHTLPYQSEIPLLPIRSSDIKT